MRIPINQVVPFEEMAKAGKLTPDFPAWDYAIRQGKVGLYGRPWLYPEADLHRIAETGEDDLFIEYTSQRAYRPVAAQGYFLFWQDLHVDTIERPRAAPSHYEPILFGVDAALLLDPPRQVGRQEMMKDALIRHGIGSELVQPVLEMVDEYLIKSNDRLSATEHHRRYTKMQAIEDIEKLITSTNNLVEKFHKMHREIARAIECCRARDVSPFRMPDLHYLSVFLWMLNNNAESVLRDPDLLDLPDKLPRGRPGRPDFTSFVRKLKSLVLAEIRQRDLASGNRRTRGAQTRQAENFVQEVVKLFISRQENPDRRLRK